MGDTFSVDTSAVGALPWRIGDADRLRGVATGYDRADRDAASQCTAPLAGGWW